MVGYFVITKAVDGLAEGVKSSAENAEKAAIRIEVGEEKVYIENLPNMYRLLAKSEMTMHSALESLNNGINKFTFAFLYAAALQAFLLYGLLRKKKM